MNRKIAISSLLNQVRVGIIEHNRLVEYYLEQSGEERLEGNVYKGRVENILPGMEAAFVDIGTGRNAFLFLPDLPGRKARKNLKKGDHLMVQVAKEGDGAKGPRVTPDIGLPGRFVVLMPYQDQIGISRRIVEKKERERLKEIAETIRPKGVGLIVRTVAEGCSKKELEEDLRFLLKEWRRIRRLQRRRSAPALLYRDYDLIHRIMRDQVAAEGTEIIVDQPELKVQVEEELAELGLKKPHHVQLYTGALDLFQHLGLQKDLERASGRRVWLDCGGYLIFDQTEALLSIDVNTGKYVGKKDLQQTVFRTNLEAAEEIPRQLRLRNVGGIVIIDFIDMYKDENRKAVLRQLAGSLEADKTRTRLLGFTSLGLVEMTRKKSRKPLDQMLQTECPLCSGSGKVIADEALALQIAADVRSLAVDKGVEAIMVQCHSAVAAQIIGAEGSTLKALEQKTGKSIFIKGDDSVARSFYKLNTGKRTELQRRSSPVQVGERLQLTISDPHARHGESGVGRINGFIIECLQCQSRIGQTVEVEIVEVHKTSALARLVQQKSAD